MLAPLEGLPAPELPGVNPGVDPGSQGVIPRRFKRKKIFVTNVGGVAGWTHRREGGNSGLDVHMWQKLVTIENKFPNVDHWFEIKAWS